MEIRTAPIAAAERPIREQVADVFEAFVDPAITSRSWFSRGSGLKALLEHGSSLNLVWDRFPDAWPCAA